MESDGRAALERALPAYEIESKLGEGAFGIVYEARHAELGRHVAIKQLPLAYAENPDVRERFVAEAQMVASLNHPHIVPVYDFVESEGSRYLIMERCAGSIGDRFRDTGLVTDEACAAVLACLAALHTAHQTGLLHRDIKPENLMYDMQGVVKLGDFGIARDLGAETRRTATGMIIGTPAYMSPEQCRGDDLTAASDVYSVGVMAFELLTGALPFPDTGSVNGLLAHHMVTEPTPLLAAQPQLPGSIGEVIDRSLAKDLNVRYSTALEFATALARACVTAFGSGWLRRRRFTLHWPEIIAETERPSEASPRTGTILVRAGFPPQALATTSDVPPASDAVNVATINYAQDPASQLPRDVSQAGAETVTDRSGFSFGWIGPGLAALVALTVGFFFLRGADNDPTLTTEPTQQEAEDTDRPDAVEPSAVPEPDDAEPDAPNTDDTDDAEPDEAPADAPTPAPADPTLMTQRPASIDQRDAYWLAPTPCPTDQDRVACIFSGVSVNDRTGAPTVAYYTEGFLPELEPTGYHVHFYLDTFVDGDENKAGAGVPGGEWKEWDAPNPATSFNGENGRALYVEDEFADARLICAIVADENHVAIPGSGNCSPLMFPSDDEANIRVINRLQGLFVGDCSTTGMIAIIPPDWQIFEFASTSPAEIVQQLTSPEPELEAELEELANAGTAFWATGSNADGEVLDASLAKLEGDFRLTSSADEVRAALTEVGIGPDALSIRTFEDREFVVQTRTRSNGLVDARYFVPDYGYAMVLTITATPGVAGQDNFADKMAAALIGC